MPAARSRARALYEEPKKKLWCCSPELRSEMLEENPQATATTYVAIYRHTTPKNPSGTGLEGGRAIVRRGVASAQKCVHAPPCGRPRSVQTNSHVVVTQPTPVPRGQRVSNPKARSSRRRHSPAAARGELVMARRTAPIERRRSERRLGVVEFNWSPMRVARQPAREE